MSRRSRKRFSGTGGISSGRTIGFSLFTLCSFCLSSSSTISRCNGLQKRQVLVTNKDRYKNTSASSSTAYYRVQLTSFQQPISHAVSLSFPLLSFSSLNVCAWRRTFYFGVNTVSPSLLQTPRRSTVTLKNSGSHLPNRKLSSSDVLVLRSSKKQGLFIWLKNMKTSVTACCVWGTGLPSLADFVISCPQSITLTSA